jgi:hypothetical protein
LYHRRALFACPPAYAETMDRATIAQHLAEAEGHVALGEQHITRQKQIIAELERDGHDTAEAKDLLSTFEATQVLHVADCDRLLEELKTFA